jgi:enediyne biosynthesis protein E4
MLGLIGCGRAPDSDLRADRAAGGKDAGRSVAADGTTPRFENLAHAAGISFIYRNGQEEDQFSIVESLGGGGAVWDYDGDGDNDLYFPGGGQFSGGREVSGRPGALFRNDGDWHFSLQTGVAGLQAAPHYSHGTAVDDYDGDGFPDLLVTGYGGLVLWHNHGDGTFLDSTAAAGLHDRLWSSSAAWGDVNGDGAPDLYVAHYLDWSFDKHPDCPAQQPGHPRDVCPPERFGPLPDVLYINRGDGTFLEGSSQAGLRPDGKGLGVVIADLDLDGDLDIYVGNDDPAGNFLYRNNGQGRFDEVGLSSGTSVDSRGHPNGSMGVALGDYNLDGLPDLWVANFERETSALYRNLGNCTFQHVSESAGVASVGSMYVGWGSVFFDLDADGDEDMIIANGHVLRYPGYSPVSQNAILFENLSGKRFVNAAARAGDYFTLPHQGRGVCCGDLNGDGELDLAISHVNEPVAVLANRSNKSRTNHWCGVRLIGTRSAREPIGCRVRLVAEGSQQVRQVIGGGSYASACDRRLHFGIGTCSTIESLEISWPSGNTSRIAAVGPDRWITIIEGENSGEFRLIEGNRRGDE